MDKIFGQESFLTNFLTTIADLMILNFMWLIGCIPIITIGASTTAVYYCVEKYRENGGVPVVKTFWKAYRSNFKKATVLFCVLLVVLGVIAVDVLVLYQTKIEIHTVVLVIMGVIALLVVIAMGYVFPLQARFENTIGRTIKNAWLMALLHLPKSILVAILNLLPVLLWLFVPNFLYQCLGLLLFIGGSGIAYINNIILQSVFKRYYDINNETRDQDPI